MKNSTTRILIFLLFCLSLVLGINYFYQPFLKSLSVEQEVVEKNIDGEQIVEPEISLKQKYMNEMTPRQKVSQILAFPVKIENQKNALTLTSASSADLSQSENSASNSTNATNLQNQENLTQIKNLDWIKNNQPGFITIFGEKIDKNSAKNSIETIHQQYSGAHLSPIIAVDHEGGSVQRLSGKDFTILPAWKDVCNSDSDKNKVILNSSARDLFEVGINVVFAPVLDLANDSKVLKSRACGDYNTALDSADLFIKTFSQYQIMPVIKHFPGIGKTTQDLHKKFDTVELGIEDSGAFKEILDLYPNIGLMTTHVGLKNVLENVPCSLSSACLEKMTDLYPETLFFSDALEMKATGYDPDSVNGEDLDKIAIKAVLAGNNVLVFGESVNDDKFNQILNSLENEYNESEIFRKKVDISLAKILLLKKVGE